MVQRWSTSRQNTTSIHYFKNSTRQVHVRKDAGILRDYICLEFGYLFENEHLIRFLNELQVWRAESNFEKSREGHVAKESWATRRMRT